MVMLKPPYDEAFEATAVDGEVVVLAHDQPIALAMTAEAAMKTGDLLKAAGISALEQRRFRRAEPPERLPRPPVADDPAS